VLNFLGGIKHYIMETNHPIVQIFYLAISPGGYNIRICVDLVAIWSMASLSICPTKMFLWLRWVLLQWWLWSVFGSITKHVRLSLVKLPNKTCDNILKNGRNTMMDSYTKRKILAEHVSSINLPDRNIVRYVKCASRSMIIIAYGKCSI